MAAVERYILKSTQTIPNSHLPLLHYRQAFEADSDIACKVFDSFAQNGWETQWINRYGNTQASHYHSTAHECMAVLSGTARIRFGAADLTSDLEESTHGAGWESGSLEVQAMVGDVFVIPAGVAHKTYDATPNAPFETLTPGGGKTIDSSNARQTVANTQLSGFTMLGAYPSGSSWDFATGSSDHSAWSKIWSTPKPERDPVLGSSPSGLCGLWQDSAENGGL